MLRNEVVVFSFNDTEYPILIYFLQRSGISQFFKIWDVLNFIEGKLPSIM